MSWSEILALSAPTGLLAIAVWRFARLEAASKHQHECNKLLVRAVSRLSVQGKTMVKELKRLAAVVKQLEEQS